MPVIVRKHIERSFVRDCRGWIFLFGDNLAERGLKGQAAAMRGEPNAIGIPTKKYPSNSKDAFFSDAEYEQNKVAIDAAFAKIPAGATVVIPEDGIGTGLAKLPLVAPRTFAYIKNKIEELTKT